MSYTTRVKVFDADEVVLNFVEVRTEYWETHEAIELATKAIPETLVKKIVVEFND